MRHQTTLDLDANRAALIAVLRDVIAAPKLSKGDLDKLVRAHARRSGTKIFSRDELIRAYRAFAGSGGLPRLRSRACSSGCA